MKIIIQLGTQQLYGFSRALAMGDSGYNGVKPGLVKNLMKTLCPLELELIQVASRMTNRSEHFIRLAREAGALEKSQNALSETNMRQVESLAL